MLLHFPLYLSPIYPYINYQAMVSSNRFHYPPASIINPLPYFLSPPPVSNPFCLNLLDSHTQSQSHEHKAKKVGVVCGLQPAVNQRIDIGYLPGVVWYIRSIDMTLLSRYNGHFVIIN